MVSSDNNRSREEAIIEHESTIFVDEDVADERTGLLKHTDRVQAVVRSEATPKWILPATFVFALLAGASVTVELEVIGQIACRVVAMSDPTLEPPASLFLRFASFVTLPGSSPEQDWVMKCRASSAVQKSSTEIITSILIAGGVLSAMTAGWWGNFSDRHGRKSVLAVTNFSELVSSAAFVAVLAFPQYLGTKALIASAVLGGLAGGEPNSIAICAAYLSDCAVEGSRTQILSSLTGLYMLGMGVGPIFGTFLIDNFASGVFLIYLGQVLARAIYLCLIPIMPESLPPSMRTHLREQPLPSSSRTSSPARKETPFFVRLLQAPVELIRPFKVLLPRITEHEASTTRGLDWRLTLIAVSYTFANIVPGMSAIKILFARGKFGWGPSETGKWITFAAASRVFLLVVAIPFVVKYLRKRPRLPERPRPVADGASTGEESVEALAWDVEAAKLKKAADTRFDLSLARTTSLITIIGYLIFSLPSATPRNYLIGTSITAFATLTIPSLQSLALAFSAPDDAGKILATLSALATFTSSTVGPSLFAAIYVFSVDWFPELVFVVAATWVALSTLPLFAVKIKPSRVVLEDAE